MGISLYRGGRNKNVWWQVHFQFFWIPGNLIVLLWTGTWSVCVHFVPLALIQIQTAPNGIANKLLPYRSPLLACDQSHQVQFLTLFYKICFVVSINSHFDSHCDVKTWEFHPNINLINPTRFITYYFNYYNYFSTFMSKLHSFTRIKKIQFFCFKITPSLLYCSGFQFTTKKKKVYRDYKWYEKYTDVSSEKFCKEFWEFPDV